MDGFNKYCLINVVFQEKYPVYIFLKFYEHKIVKFYDCPIGDF